MAQCGICLCIIPPVQLGGISLCPNCYQTMQKIYNTQKIKWGVGIWGINGGSSPVSENDADFRSDIKEVLSYLLIPKTDLDFLIGPIIQELDQEILDFLWDEFKTQYSTLFGPSYFEFWEEALIHEVHKRREKLKTLAQAEALTKFNQEKRSKEAMMTSKMRPDNLRAKKQADKIQELKDFQDKYVINKRKGVF